MENLYIVSYDISCPKRWRQVYRTMKGYGRWLQLSVFQCRLTKARAIRLKADLEELVHRFEDHVVIVDLGPADKVKPRVQTIGAAFEPIRRKPVII